MTNGPARATITKGEKMKNLDKYKLITAIFQLVSGLVLIGISVYYYVTGQTQNFFIFLVIGIIFVVMPVITFIKMFLSKNKDDDDENGGKPKGFL